MDLQINVQAGKSVLTLGKTGSLLNNIILSLSIIRGSWWFNPGFGSRLDQLAREKDTPRSAMLAVEYAKEALAWMVETGRAKSVEAVTSHQEGKLALTVTVTTPDGAKVDFTQFVTVGE
jgi:phage gp46-like protein